MINRTSVFWLLLVGYLPVQLLMPKLIAAFRARMLGQTVREDGPQHHAVKTGTPTGGGALFLLATVIAAGLLVWIHPEWMTYPAWSVFGAFWVLGALGFLDDWKKIVKKHNKGITGYTKLTVQVLVGVAIAIISQIASGEPMAFVSLAFLGKVAWCALVVAATSNAVNLTDGLDGLAASTSAVTFLTLGSCLTGWFITSPVLMGHTRPDLAAPCFILAGVMLAFLAFNRKPAQIFMGDTGSLATGGALAAVTLFAGWAWWLWLAGIVFCLEALSVVLQVASFKLTGKRIFKMSPIHHHFELCGWSEQRVVATFFVVQCLGCLLAFVLLNRVF